MFEGSPQYSWQNRLCMVLRLVATVSTRRGSLLATDLHLAIPNLASIGSFIGKCPQRHHGTKACPECGADMRGTGEKGVDVRMAADMIQLAWVYNEDVAGLASSDADFVPVAEFLERRGIKVIHGTFPPKGHHLSSCCWGRIDPLKLREELRFRKGE